MRRVVAHFFGFGFCGSCFAYRCGVGFEGHRVGVTCASVSRVRRRAMCMGFVPYFRCEVFLGGMGGPALLYYGGGGRLPVLVSTVAFVNRRQAGLVVTGVGSTSSDAVGVKRPRRGPFFYHCYKGPVRSSSTFYGFYKGTLWVL